MVTQFDASRLKTGHAVRIRTQPAYWQAVRAQTDWAVVDAPAAGARPTQVSPSHRRWTASSLSSAPTRRHRAKVEAVRREIEGHGGKGWRRRPEPGEEGRALHRPDVPVIRAGAPPAQSPLGRTRGARRNALHVRRSFPAALVAPGAVDVTGEVPRAPCSRYLRPPFYGIVALGLLAAGKKRLARRCSPRRGSCCSPPWPSHPPRGRSIRSRAFPGAGIAVLATTLLGVYLAARR